MFFVGKKDGSKRMVMDYQNLNSQTVKNNYLLPLITELIDNMGSKKVFTKMDLRWGFNNFFGVTPLENFLQKCSMGYTLYPWISLLEPTLKTSYKPQT